MNTRRTLLRLADVCAHLGVFAPALSGVKWEHSMGLDIWRAGRSRVDQNVDVEIVRE